MAATAVQRPQSVGRPSNLPVIEHPMARLGSKRHLNVIGLNRVGIASAGSIKTYQGDDFTTLPSLKGKKHTRNTTWPADDNRRSPIDVIIRRRLEPERLYSLVQDRLSTHFRVFHQQFKANDPQGRGAVSKGAFSRVLYHLVGFVAMEDVTRLLDWLGIDSTDGVSLTKFVSAFRESETNSKRWVTPFIQNHGSREAQVTFPEEHLRNRIQHRDPDYLTATYANALLKEKCKHSDFDLRDHLLASCFEPGALVLAPQLERCLESLGVHLRDEELEILWSRYDLQNTGAVDAAWFFEHIGLDRSGHYLPKARTATQNTTRSWSLPAKEEDSDESKVPERQTSRMSSRPGMVSTSNEPRPPSTDIISSLMRKMEQSYYSLVVSCEHFDANNNGMMTKANLMGVLREFGIPLSPFDMELLLERCKLWRKDHLVSYKDFLYKFMIRSSQGIAHRVIMDPSHCFSNKMVTAGGFILSAEDAEAKLVEILHKDFLNLLGTFKSLDPHCLHVLTQLQFRNSINNVFNIRVTDQQFRELLYQVGTTEDGLVPYPEFLAIFNKKRYFPTNFHSNQRPDSQGGRDSPASPPAPPSAPKPESPTVPTVSQRLLDSVLEQSENISDRRKKYLMEGRFKPVHQIAASVQEQLRYNRLAAKETFEKLDAKKTGRVSRTQLHYWLQALGVVLHPTELQNVWKVLKTGRDGLVHQTELLDFFTHDERRRHLLENQAALQKSKASYNELPDYHNGIQRSKLNEEVKIDTHGDSLDLPNPDSLGNIRPQIVKHWEELKGILRDLDPDGYGCITIHEFKNVCNYMKFILSEDQLLKLCQQFDLNQNNQFHYLQFMQMFVRSSSPQHQSNIPHVNYNKNIHKIVYHGTKGVVEDSMENVLIKIKKQLMKEWKNLRRAFKKADCQKDGYLTVVEFKTCIRKVIKDMKEDDLFYILCELDDNMDGQIYYEEFLLLFKYK